MCDGSRYRHDTTATSNTGNQKQPAGNTYSLVKLVPARNISVVIGWQESTMKGCLPRFDMFLTPLLAFLR